ncbi:molybdopterin-dependent oxidoreductase [Nocardioides antri]|uniref:Molybdopterin-dependent oxidoreductase n=1 Tax=Nocardioides antri TaxID=2607659 RepID=A0A5B1M6R4_9ACTN|nr:molybdopterin-dependent oxidoreductase [Nocardioides antri]KAA1427410.1 molybdopterin-dependent oxidoreductase [Nocardioides antri]
MRVSRGWWWLSGVVVGAIGLAVSYLVAGVLGVRSSPVVAVAESIRDLAPTGLVEWAKETFGTADKAVPVIGIFVFLVIAFGALGRLARTQWWGAIAGYAALGVIAAVAVMTRPDFITRHLAPVVVGFLAWLVALAVLAAWLRKWELADGSSPSADEPPGQDRRGFFLAAGAVGGVSLLAVVLGKVFGDKRDAVERDRETLRVDRVTKPVLPRGTKVDVEGVRPWQTPVEDFYLIDTTILSRPAIRLRDWELRIHGMVERELVINYADLVSRGITQDWITLNCVSNEVGGDLIGNAWWSGFRLAGILAEAGPEVGADAVLQTSEDGWNCATPLAALTDDRNAMLAVYMNGEPLTVEHGFPVRTIVPGLYGYVSACKWVVDMEVTTFDAVEAYWTSRGWSEEGPVKISSRIDVPNDGDDVPAGTLVCAGTAWKQHTGIEGVEVSLDGGAWTAAELARVPNADTWVQWRAEIDVPEGDHKLRVRAIGKDDDVQTGVERDVLPDGSTGWHSIEFSASA